MLVATFGPTTGWAGKSISCDNGRFSLEGHGPISAADVLMYDSQGHLIWADDGLRELVQQTLSPPPAPPVPPQIETPQPTTVQQTSSPPPATPDPSQTVTPQWTTADYERFYEQITMTSVADTVAELLTHPFGFHGDTGIRDDLYARLHAQGGARLRFDDPRAGFSTLLLQSEHYTQAQYIGSGQAPRAARFDLALTAPPKASDPIEERYAERLSALFAFELGKNKASGKVIDPDILDHAADATPGTSDVSKLYRELVHHDLRQGWAIEFYDSRGGNGAATISSTLNLCKGLAVPEGKKLVVVFVGFSADRKHLVSSNDPQVQSALIARLAERGVEAGPDPVAFPRDPAPDPTPKPRREPDDWEAPPQEVFKERAEFAKRIIEAAGMEARGRKARYVNLNSAGRTLAQVHPQGDGIGLVLCRRGDNLPAVLFEEIPVASLAGYTGPNARWLDGRGHPYEGKGPAVAFLIPDHVVDLGDDDREWQDIVRLLKYAKTL